MHRSFTVQVYTTVVLVVLYMIYIFSSYHTDCLLCSTAIVHDMVGDTGTYHVLYLAGTCHIRAVHDDGAIQQYLRWKYRTTNVVDAFGNMLSPLRNASIGYGILLLVWNYMVLLYRTRRGDLFIALYN